MKTFTAKLLTVGTLALYTSGFSQQLFKDLVTGMEGNYQAGSYPESFTNINGTMYFSGKDKVVGSPNAGTSLYKSDGTPAGTSLIKVLGAVTSLNQLVFGFYDFNGTTIFVSRANGANHNELWKTDGTTGGTSMVKSFTTSSYATDYPQAFATIGGTVFFSSNDGNGVELWKSDGTPGGTSQVVDLWPGINIMNQQNSGVQQYASQSRIVAYNNKIYFWGYDGTNEGLYTSDGTGPGTTLVKAINKPGLNFMTVFNGFIFFNDNNANLWRSDGTAAGTNTVSGISGATSYLVFNNNFFVSGNTLYKTDGTPAGTQSLQANAGNFCGANSTAFYTGNGYGPTATYNKSDGTLAGTGPVDWRIGAGASFDLIGNKMYISRVDSGATITYSNFRIWETDGTYAGTVKLGVTYSAFHIFNNDLFYQWSDAIAGNEPWIYTPGMPTAIESHQAQGSSVLIYPNPAQSEINVIVPEKELSSSPALTLLNSMGQVVLKQKLDSHTSLIRFESLSAGMYFYSVHNDEKTIGSGKLIVK